MESLRGLAVLLLVGSHVYGLGPNEGLRVEGDTIGRYVTESLEFIRMPLFTVISGYVYALRPVGGRGALPHLLRGKSRRLLLPLLPLTAIIGGLQIVSGRGAEGLGVADVAAGYVFGFSHLWFLQAIFLVFMLVGALDAFGQLRTPRRIGTAIALAASLYVLVKVPAEADVFSLNGAIQLLPFFLLGCALARFPGLMSGRVVAVAAAGLFAVAFAVDQVVVLTDPELQGWARRLVLAVAGTTGATCLFRIRHLLTWRPLAWLGGFAFTVYLLHTIANAAAKEALGVLGVTAAPALFVVGLAAAVLAPVAFHVTFGRYSFVRLLLLGEKPLVHRRPEQAERPLGASATPAD